MSQQGVVQGATEGVISNVGLVDLRGASNEDIAKIKLIENAGCVLVPESRQGALLNVPKKNVGAVLPLPDGVNVRMLTGQLKMSGDALEVADDPDALLVIIGQVVFTSPVRKIGYKKVHILGQVLAPRGSEDALVRGISNLTGQTVFVPPDARMFVGKDTFGRAFLEFFDKPATLVLVGLYEFAPDVTADVLKKHVAEIILVGMLKAPKAVVPCVQFLCREKNGMISEL